MIEKVTLKQDEITDGHEFLFGACRCCGLELAVQVLETNRGKYVIGLCDNLKPNARDPCPIRGICKEEYFTDDEKCDRFDIAEKEMYIVMSNFIEAEFFKALMSDGIIYILWDKIINHVIKETSYFLKLKAYENEEDSFGVVINVEKFKDEVSPVMREIEI